MKRMTGFALLPKERQKEMAGIGGKAAHQRGTAHEWNPEAAALAGRKGGLVRAQRLRDKKLTKETEQPT